MKSVFNSNMLFVITNELMIGSHIITRLCLQSLLCIEVLIVMNLTNC